jgi:hypothetical protein
VFETMRFFTRLGGVEAERVRQPPLDEAPAPDHGRRDVTAGNGELKSLATIDLHVAGA